MAVLGVSAPAAACTRPPSTFETGPGRVHVQGWLDERDLGTARIFRLTVDGREVTRGAADDPPRPAWWIVGGAHRRVEATVPVAPGRHDVCLHSGEGGEPPAQCRAVTVPAPDAAPAPDAPAPSRPAPPPPTNAAPPPAPAPAPAAPSAGGWQADRTARVNAARAEAGAPPLVACATLERSAQAYAETMASGNWFSHTGPDGSTPMDRARAAGYVAAGGSLSVGENIAKGYPDVAAVMRGWLDSPGHRANILAPRTTHLGVGRSGVSWVQEFGSGGRC